MMELRPHQKKAAKELENGKILVGDVGTGKSLVAVAYYVAREAPRDIYVITTAKKRDSLDWEREFTHFGVGGSRDATMPGRGVLKVDSWNNIGKYVDVKDAFFVFDEQRLVGSGAWVRSFLKITKSNRWVLLSATPGDTWLDYIPVFLANGFYKNRTEFKRRHVVYRPYSKFPKVDRYLETGRLVRLRNQILVEMPYARTTERVITWKTVEHDRNLVEQVTKKRWNVYENKPLKDVGDLFRVVRKVVNTDYSRLEAVRALLSIHPRLIVFYNFDYELEMLRTLVCQSQLDESSSLGSMTMDSTPTSNSIPISLPASGERQNPICEPIRISPSKTTSGLTTTTSTGTSATGLAQGNGSDQQTGGSSSGDTTSTPVVDVGLNPTQALSGISKKSNVTSQDPDKAGTAEPIYPETVIAEWNGHKHEPVPTSERWVYLVQYAAGSEGWNCTSTDAMCFYSLTYSYKHWHQAFGRIDRLNTRYTQLYYYVLSSTAWIDLAIRKSLSAKKSFNESSFGVKF